HRVTRKTAAWLAGLPTTLRWARGRRLAAPAMELLAAALTAEQPSDVAAATLRGLGLSGAPLVRVQQALAAGGPLSAQLAAATRRSAEARALREAGPLTPAWTHLSGDESLRARLDDVARDTPETRAALGGEALLQLGVPRGPAVAAVLAALRDARLDGAIRDRDGEVDYVRSWLASRTPVPEGLTPLGDSPEEGGRGAEIHLRDRPHPLLAGQGPGGRLDRRAPGGARLSSRPSEDGSLHQRRRRDHEPLSARRGLRHRRRRRDRPRPRAL